MQFRTGNLVQTMHDPVPWEDFCRFHPRPKSATAGSKTSTKKKVDMSESIRQQLLSEFPWLTDEDLGIKLGKKKPATPGERHASESDESEDRDVVVETAVEIPDEHVDVDALAKQVVMNRKLWDHESSHMFFYVTQRGGKWTAEKKEDRN